MKWLRNSRNKTHLYRGKIPLVEHGCGLMHNHSGIGVPHVLGHATARVGVAEARRYLIPVSGVRHPILEPPGIVTQLVLQEGAVEHHLPVAVVGDGVGEDDEEEERGDHDEHGDEVELQEPRDAVAGAREAREGYHQDGQSDDDERPLQEAEAVGRVRLHAQPYAAPEYRDGHQEGYEVHDADDTRASPYHLFFS